jgi:hypothetical protein
MVDDLKRACESCGDPQYGVEPVGSKVCRLAWPAEKNREIGEQIIIHSKEDTDE